MNSITINNRRVLPIEAACVKLDCSVPTFRRLVTAGQIKPQRAHGRVWFDEAAIEALRVSREKAR